MGPERQRPQDLRSLAQPLRTEPSTAPKHSTSPTGTTTGILFPSGTRPRSAGRAGMEGEDGDHRQPDRAGASTAAPARRQEGVAKTGAWEIGVALPKMLADLVSSGSVEDLSGWIERYNPEIDSGESQVIKPLADAVKINGAFSRCRTDGDAVVAFGVRTSSTMRRTRRRSRTSTAIRWLLGYLEAVRGHRPLLAQPGQGNLRRPRASRRVLRLHELPVPVVQQGCPVRVLVRRWVTPLSTARRHRRRPGVRRTQGRNAP